MANTVLEYGPYNSKADSKREYEAKDIGRMFDGIVTDGVFPYIGECFKIERDEGLNIKVKTGRGFFKHTWNYLENPMLFKLKNGDAMYPRYDAVFIRIGCSELVRENIILVKTGEPSNNPVPPSLDIHEDSQYEYVLGYIYVPVNANTIESDTQITNLVGNNSDPNGFYNPGEYAEYAYAITSNNHIGMKLVEVDKNDSEWNELTGSDGTPFYERTNIPCTGIVNDAIVTMDSWVEGTDILSIQKQQNAFSSIFWHSIRDGKLTLRTFFKPDVAFTLRFVGTGVSNINN